ncbi:transcriptional regulator, partial [Halobacteriales archaeon QH_1_68_42]
MSSMHSTSDTVEEKNPKACPTVEAIEEIGSKWRLV